MIQKPRASLLSKEWFSKSKKNNIEQDYIIDLTNPLGKGTFGTVYPARLRGKGPNCKRAVKKIPKIKVKDRGQFRNQVEILQKLDHPHIIKLYQTYEDSRNIYMVTQVCQGGELFDKIIKKGFFTEEEARAAFKQMVLAVNYLHSQKVGHRDLKPENFLYLETGPQSPIKLIDFGLSFRDHIASNSPTQGLLAGTAYYMAPEIANKSDYDFSCDIWSLGVILYILVSSVPPFDGDTDQDILQKVKRMEYTFDIPEMKGVSQSLKDLVSRMLVEAKHRPSAELILTHPWLNKKSSQTPLPLKVANLQRFCSFSKLKKIAVTMIATQLEQKDILGLGSLFKQIDLNNDGVLTVQELKVALQQQKQNVPMADIQRIIDTLDTEGQGKINYTSFVAGSLEKTTICKEQNIMMAFRMMDTDKNGIVSKEQIQHLLEQHESTTQIESVEEIISSCDLNGDGVIDQEQFMSMMQKD